jgi:hypothetical protein
LKTEHQNEAGSVAVEKRKVPLGNLREKLGLDEPALQRLTRALSDMSIPHAFVSEVPRAEAAAEQYFNAVITLRSAQIGIVYRWLPDRDAGLPIAGPAIGGRPKIAAHSAALIAENGFHLFSTQFVRSVATMAKALHTNQIVIFLPKKKPKRRPQQTEGPEGPEEPEGPYWDDVRRIWESRTGRL